MSRSCLRNVNLFDGLTRDHLGGVRQNGSITSINSFNMLTDILLVVEAPITIKLRDTGHPLPLNTEPFKAGDYDIFCSQGNLRRKITDDVCMLRLVNQGESAQEDSFRDGVRARDGSWCGFEAAHIFPMEQEELWNKNNYSQWITNETGCHSATIDSIQNGILLSASMHRLFDVYFVGVNPDDNYKITHFSYDNWGVDNRVLEDVCRKEGSSDRVADGLCRWHFRQCVLANTKGDGEPVFEHDFPPGTGYDRRDPPGVVSRRAYGIGAQFPASGFAG
ncbi:hypothetical protein N7530_006885 [Penicillium desertorum]|uniref:HNH nuclease domain-containing protein n=1 Tax=Penicillium desertorum TaxID=1303715 RepID=A0A9X0BMP2_9EURO|nr:hypothetical protein N7530_006885 [Penicillium desertorum]